jgi:hypothetical protein
MAISLPYRPAIVLHSIRAIDSRGSDSWRSQLDFEIFVSPEKNKTYVNPIEILEATDAEQPSVWNFSEGHIGSRTVAILIVGTVNLNGQPLLSNSTVDRISTEI